MVGPDDHTFSESLASDRCVRLVGSPHFRNEPADKTGAKASISINFGTAPSKVVIQPETRILSISKAFMGYRESARVCYLRGCTLASRTSGSILAVAHLH